MVVGAPTYGALMGCWHMVVGALACAFDLVVDPDRHVDRHTSRAVVVVGVLLLPVAFGATASIMVV